MDGNGMSWHPAFAAVQRMRAEQKNDNSLLAWLHEERWWKYDPDWYEQVKAQAQAELDEEAP